MDLSTLRTGEKLAGASGTALFLIMIIFDWFGAETVDVGFGGAEFETANAFQAFDFIDAILLIAVIAAVALPAVSLIQARVDLPVALSAIVALLGIVSVILILFRIINPPDFTIVGGIGSEDTGAETTRKIGVWLGLLAAAGVAAGGWVAMSEEGTSLTAERDRISGRGDRPPPSAGVDSSVQNEPSGEESTTTNP